jgi:UDP-glucose 4-epimerase
MPKYFICGGAGFIGSHLVRAIFREEPSANVVVYDNFSSGSLHHLEAVKENKRLKIIRADIKDLKKLCRDISEADIIYHLASNPDIAKGIRQPDIDFWEGTYLTNNVLEAMRKNRIKKLLYASGSGVYGELGTIRAKEDESGFRPISTYGASKLACEALISAYSYLFGMRACTFRFANVVGPHQTHGVGLDFIRKLMKNPRRLLILGDGKQTKPYIYVEDAVRAMQLLQKQAPRGFSSYNVATQDYLTVKQIADIVVETMELKGVKYEYSGTDRGWKGDVPVVRLNSKKIRRLGWRNRYSSKEAVSLSVRQLYEELTYK